MNPEKTERTSIKELEKGPREDPTGNLGRDPGTEHGRKG